MLVCSGPSQVLKQIPQNQAPVTITLAKKPVSTRLFFLTHLKGMLGSKEMQHLKTVASTQAKRRVYVMIEEIKGTTTHPQNHPRSSASQKLYHSSREIIYSRFKYLTHSLERS